MGSCPCGWQRSCRTWAGQPLPAPRSKPPFSLSYNLAMSPDPSPQRPPEPDQQMKVPVGLGQQEPERSAPWVSMAIGAGLLALIVVGAILLSRSGEQAASGKPHPYASN